MMYRRHFFFELHCIYSAQSTVSKKHAMSYMAKYGIMFHKWKSMRNHKKIIFNRKAPMMVELLIFPSFSPSAFL